MELKWSIVILGGDLALFLANPIPRYVTEAYRSKDFNIDMLDVALWWNVARAPSNQSKMQSQGHLFPLNLFNIDPV